MPKLKVLGGDDLIAIFSGFGFAIESQSIFRQALRYIPEHKLKSSFYGD
jgi:hypothetical protein